MLKRLTIENAALLEKADLSFDGGLSVLTGETGAGKSVVVNALALALGGRADKDFIRHGTKVCRVTALFDISHTSSKYKSEYSRFIKDDSILVNREISKEGGSKVKVNGQVASLSILKNITTPLAEILGQHSSQELLNENNHLAYLDRFASLVPLRDTVAEKYRQWKFVLEELFRYKSKREQLMNERELLLFQKDEIEKAEIRPGEEETLLKERKILDSARSLMNSSSIVRQLLDNEEQSVLTLLNMAHREIEKMAEIDESLNGKVESIVNLQYEIEDIRAFIERYGSSLNDDPGRIEEINLRLDEIYNLKKKYGGSEEGILNSLTVIKEKLKIRPNVDTVIEKLENENESLRTEYTENALKLSAKRKKAAGNLQKLIGQELKDLAIENGGFEFEFISEDDPDGVIINGRAVKPFEYGLENGRILFSANPGEPLKSLVKTASGGEISRVLLALKSAETKNDRLKNAMLLFDEVDAGIGGQTAVSVGKKLKKLARNNQVIVITHLHQIGRLADNHFVAQKSSSEKKASITVNKLSKEEIRDELDRMIALPEQT